MRLILILFLCLTACTNNSKKTIEDRMPLKQREGNNFLSKKDSLDIIRKSKIYEKVYVAEEKSGIDNYSQKLFVNWISKDSVEYKIDYENQLCEGSCYGVATLKSIDQDQKFDEFNGKTYSIVQYEEIKKPLRIVIRIDQQNRDKAKTSIFEGEYHSECSPFENIMFLDK